MNFNYSKIVFVIVFIQGMQKISVEQNIDIFKKYNL